MNHCGRFIQRPLTRREMLSRCASGFGVVALTALLSDGGVASDAQAAVRAAAPGPFAPKLTHFRAPARNVIFLYMDGGVSQVDSFDPKPLLEKEHGQPFKMKMEPTQFNNNGNTLGCPWKFRNYGQCGMPV